MSTPEDTIKIANATSIRADERRRKVRRDRIILLATAVLVAGAWLYGYFANGTDLAPLVSEVIPGAVHIQKQGDLFVGVDAEDQVLGYAAAGEAPGYAGPITVLVGVDPAGDVLGVTIVKQSESPGFFRLIENHEFNAQYENASITQPLTLGEDIDAVSGATRSSEGIAYSVKQAVSKISAQAFDTPIAAESKPIQFGWPEIAILGLYAVGYFGHKMRNRTWQKRIRWGMLITGIVVVGFVYTIPFTITMVVSLVSGYWPDWHTSLYWYFLIGGILFVTTIDAKNPYCSWFCPFGAVQEALAQIGGAKVYRPRDLSEFFTWLQRGLSLAAVVLGLAFRRPGIASYEPFATLFDLRGSGIELIFLGLILLVSLFIYRPFCNYLCPLDPVYDFVTNTRKWVLDGVKTWRKPNQTA